LIFDRIESDRYTNIYRYFKTSLILIFTVVLYLPLISVPLTAAEQPEGDFQTVKTFHDIVFLTIAGTINPVSSRYVIREIRKAGEVSSLVVLQLDTPGGLESSTGDINRAILNSPVPVITYVSPRGARAASAGAFIMMASHITVMAPGTTMGAAHPVGLGGGMFGKQSNNTEAIMNDKITNILVSTMRTLAETHGRNTEVAATMVSESKSFTEKQALEAGLIDFIAGDVKELLRGLEGHPVQLQGKLFYISLSGNSKGRPVIMNYREELLNYLANPTVALIFMMLGIYGLIYEFTTPGFGFAGATGIFCLILAFFGLQNFPISVAGVALILLGAALLILEVKVISYGFLTLGGVGSIITGSMMLIDSKDATMQVSIRVLLGLATVLTVVFLLLLSVIIKAYRKKPRLGPASLIGLTGEVRELLCPEGGLVFVRGELWKAQLTGGGKAKRGTPIRIDKVRGNLVIVSTVEEG
jgi:membrane-bound serine protease (ClpP class)